MSDAARLVRSPALSDVAEYAYACVVTAGSRLVFTAGAGLGDVVRTTVYVASSDRDDLGAAWQVVREALAPDEPPSTLLGVAVLGYPDQLVEVDAVAVLPG